MDWTDDWALYYKNPQINPIQDSVVRMASGVIVVNERLKQRASRLREGADNVFMLPNATALKPCKHLPCPADISQIPMPRIGYCGHLGPWFDPEVINEIARARPQWQWVMVGYLNSEAQKVLSGLPNVHLLGPRKFDELQAYMAQCQVLASPYKENFEGDATKLYDYLTVGAPIVSSAIETAYRLQPYVKVVSDVGSWIEAIQQSLSEKNGGLREARQEESLKHSWNARSAALIDWLYRL
jgi:glycosyltransferase involved in cell wall biosynthesis